MNFTLHDEQTASAEAKPHLEATRKAFGMIPNLERVMAEAPPLLDLYVHGEELIDKHTSLSPIETNIVMQQSNYENNCTYCVPWHTLLSRKAGVPEEHVQAQREGRPLSDAKLEALRRFTADLIEHRGHPPQATVDAFFAAGYTQRHALEVVLCLAVKLMSNYTNGIAHTPLDGAVQKFGWTKPGNKSADAVGTDVAAGDADDRRGSSRDGATA